MCEGCLVKEGCLLKGVLEGVRGPCLETGPCFVVLTWSSDSSDPLALCSSSTSICK